MKKIMMLAVMAITIGLQANAQKVDAAKVPAAVKASCAKSFPGAAVSWEKEGSNYEAGFKQNGNTMSALFDAKGMMKESEMDMPVSSLPTSVLAYVKTHYPGKKIKEGAKITKADGTVNYEAEVGGKDVLFDAAGKYLKEVKD